jgi:hypothetical protein
MPANAKISRRLLRANVGMSGGFRIARFSGSIAKMPPAMNSRSGRIFATVITVFTRAPRSTPRMLTVANAA